MLQSLLIKLWNPHKEVCGIVTTDNTVLQVDNVAKCNDSFIMDRRQYLNFINSGVVIQAIYHSHPSGNTQPSARDIIMFSRLPYDMIIVGKTEINWIRKDYYERNS